MLREAGGGWRLYTNFLRTLNHAHLYEVPFAADNGVPFYVALPSTTIDWTIADGVREIPIEERDGREVSHVRGRCGDSIVDVATTADDTPVSNYAFDVTPARLVTGLITEAGVCEASEAGLAGLFPDRARDAS